MNNMHKTMLGLALAAMAPLAAAQESAAAPAAAPAAAAPAAQWTPSEAFSYYIGYMTGAQMTAETKSISMDDINKDKLLEGLAAALKGERPSQETIAAMEAPMKAFTEELAKRDDAAAAANEEAGKKFLEENAKKPGVTTTASGLQYKVITEGKGRKFDADKDGDGAIAAVVYEGKLVNGTVFDSSQGQPVDFPITQVIPGFTEALKLMPIGSTWEVCIPSELAYGDQNLGPISANSTLIFTMTLKDIKKAPAKPAAGSLDALTPEIEAALRAQGLDPQGGEIVPATPKK